MRSVLKSTTNLDAEPVLWVALNGPIRKLMSIAIALRRLPLLLLLMAQGCDKDPETCPDPGTTLDGTGFMALLDVLEDHSASTDQITTNTGYISIYSLAVETEAGDVLRIRGQVEMSNDILGQGQGAGSTTIRGHMRLLTNGAIVGNLTRQNNVADPLDPEHYHHMHHMPLWADAFVLVSHGGQTLVEAQYATSKSGSSPIVAIEPSYGHVVVEHYRLFASREEAEASGALGLDDVLVDAQENVQTFQSTEGVVAYHLGCSLAEGDIVRTLGQATSGYSGMKALHGQKIYLNETRISATSSENNIGAIPNLPLWTDGTYKSNSGQSVSLSLRLNGATSDPTFGPADVLDGGYLYALHFRPLTNSSSARQLVSVVKVPGPSSDFPLVANTGWHSVAVHQGTANEGDVLRATGFIQLAGPNDFDHGVNCQFRIRINGSIVQSGKYITPRLEMLPLRTENLFMMPSSGPYTVEAEVSCSRYDADPTVDIVGGLSGIIVERFAE